MPSTPLFVMVEAYGYLTHINLSRVDEVRFDLISGESVAMVYFSFDNSVRITEPESIGRLRAAVEHLRAKP